MYFCQKLGDFASIEKSVDKQDCVSREPMQSEDNTNTSVFQCVQCIEITRSCLAAQLWLSASKTMSWGYHSLLTL